MLNDYLSDLRLLKMLGLIMLGLTLLWITISGISSLIQHWRRPKRPDAPAPLPADDREDFIRDRKREEPNKREMPLPNPFLPLRSDDDIVIGDFHFPWESKINKRPPPGIPEAKYWAIDPAGVNQAGTVYSVQGFETQHVGVIVGPDLVNRDGQ